MTAVPQTKIQRAGVRAKRIVFVSCASEDPVKPVRDALVAKFRGQADQFLRSVHVIFRDPGVAGQRADVVPWDPYVPTDVVVLLSNNYMPEFVSEETIAPDDVKHDLNIVLRQRAFADDAEDYNVWLGIVQKVNWELVFVENKRLGEFEHMVHELIGGRKFGAEKPLDDDAFEAAEAIKQHRATDCSHCKRSMRPRERPGLLARLFNRRRS